MPSYYSTATKRRMAQSFKLHRNVKIVAHLYGASEATVRRAIVTYSMHRFHYRKLESRKLNDMEVRFIRRACKSVHKKITKADIKRALGCSYSCITRIQQGATYKEV